MKAIVLHAVNDLRYEEVHTPAPQAGEALIRIAACGVCGSDLPRCFEKGTYHFPTICGHEFAGVVEKIGAGAGRFAAGAGVTVFPLLWCGKCPACAEGKYAQCSDYDYFGSRRDGAFAEYLVAPLRNLVPVPMGVSMEEAAMTEPAAVARHALRRVGERLTGKSVAIFGAGPIGLMVAQWARAMNAAFISIYDLLPRKLEMAQAMGFTQVFNSREVAPAEADITVDAAGAPAALLTAMSVVARNGHVVLLGNPAGDLHLPAKLWSQLMRREVQLHGTWNSDFSATGTDDDWRAALAAMANGKLNLQPLISHRVPLADTVAVLNKMRDGKEFFAKVLVQP